MARRTSLRDFQESLASRLKAAAGAAASEARLAFEAGGSLWLVRLEDSGEVLPVPAVERVPLTRDWFLGVANVRGVIYGVTDLAAFIGGAPTARGPDNRLLLAGQPHGMNAALLVSRLAGLRNVGQLSPVEDAVPRAPWAERAWSDAEGRVWQELDSAKLVADRQFLDVAQA
jgi:twitching motility protein PilI